MFLVVSEKDKELKSTENSENPIAFCAQDVICGPHRIGVVHQPLVIILVLLVLIAQTIGYAQSSDGPVIGIDEALGQYVPLGLSFTDSDGTVMTLDELVDRPTVIVLVYYKCPGICPLLLNGTTEVLSKLQLNPGVDYNVVTISFDETDTPDTSLQQKKNYLHSLQKIFPENAWRFVTGDLETIEAFTDAVGFRFQRQGIDFAHPAALIVLGKDGKISRYLYGTTFLPFDLKMAIVEAAEGRVGPTINRMLKYCFSYDPEGRTYVFNVTRVAGSVVILLAVIFLTVLLIKGSVHRKAS